MNCLRFTIHWEQSEEENVLAKAPRRKVFHRQGTVLVRALIRTESMNSDRDRSCLLCVLATLREKKGFKVHWEQSEEENVLAKAIRRKVFHRQGTVLVRTLIRTESTNPDRKRDCLLCVLATLRAKKGFKVHREQSEEENVLAKAQRRKVFHRQGTVLVRTLIRTESTNPDRKRDCLLCVFATLRAKKGFKVHWEQSEEENVLAKAPRRKVFHR